jgi:redox-sensitive bicupin YhaK (pirin superfamily)
MIEHRPVAKLNGGDFGWLKAKHHFYVGHGNPDYKPLGNLYVWNDDEIAAGKGFPLHPHRDVEIITYVREGYVLHTDSIGESGQTNAGDVQVMSAGTGIKHSEAAAPDQLTKIFQIWIKPREPGGEPRRGSKPFPKTDRAGRFVVLASGFADDTEALTIRADARVLGATLQPGQSIVYDLAPGRIAYLVATSGKIVVNDVVLEARDGAALQNEKQVRIDALENTEIIMVDTV